MKKIPFITKPKAYSMTSVECSDPLDKYPSLIRSNEFLKNKSLTFGDLHANSLKLLSNLITWGLVSLSPKLYEKFATFYKRSSETTDKDYKDFYYSEMKKILEKVTVNVPENFILRFLGDTFYDRGPDDRITREILNILYSAGLKTEETISNHTFELLLAYEDFTFLKTLEAKYKQSCSMIESELKTVEMQAFMRQFYSRLNLVCYEVGINKNNEKELLLSSHAPAFLKSIIEAIKAMGIDINPDEKISDVDTFTGFIDKMNHKFRDILLNGTYREKYELFNDLQEEGHPLWQLIWQRKPSLNSREEALANISPNLSISYCHGHDSQGDISWDDDLDIYHSIYNLDNFRGFPGIPDTGQSEIVLICSNRIKSTLMLGESAKKEIFTEKPVVFSDKKEISPKENVGLKKFVKKEVEEIKTSDERKNTVNHPSYSVITVPKITVFSHPSPLPTDSKVVRPRPEYLEHPPEKIPKI